MANTFLALKRSVQERVNLSGLVPINLEIELIPAKCARPFQACWSKDHVPAFHLLNTEPLQLFNSYVTNNYAKNRSAKYFKMKGGVFS